MENPRELKRLRHLNDEELEKETDILLNLLANAPNDVINSVLLQLDLLTLYRMSRLNSRLHTLTDPYRAKNVWQQFFYRQFNTRRDGDAYIQALLPILNEPVMYGEAAHALNWRWAAIAYYGVSILSSVCMPTQRFRRPEKQIRIRLPDSTHYLTIKTVASLGYNDMFHGEHEPNWTEDDDDPRNMIPHIGVLFKPSSFIRYTSDAKYVNAYAYRYTRHSNVGVYGGEPVWVTYNPLDMYRMLYTMLQNGFAYDYATMFKDRFGQQRIRYTSIRGDMPQNMPWDY